MDGTTTHTLGPNLSQTFAIVDPNAVASALFALIVFLVVLYTIIAMYHWLRYGHSSVATIPAIAVHIFVSTGLILFAAGGLF